MADDKVLVVKGQRVMNDDGIPPDTHTTAPFSVKNQNMRGRQVRKSVDTFMPFCSYDDDGGWVVEKQ